MVFIHIDETLLFRLCHAIIHLNKHSSIIYRQSIIIYRCLPRSNCFIHIYCILLDLKSGFFYHVLIFINKSNNLHMNQPLILKFKEINKKHRPTWNIISLNEQSINTFNGMEINIRFTIDSLKWLNVQWVRGYL